MKMTVCNPQKGRLETIDIEFNENNTTWFNEHRTARDIRLITDLDGGLLISEFDYTYPIWIYDVSRADIGYDQMKAKQLRRRYQ
jgi:hypothetical protein